MKTVLRITDDCYSGHTLGTFRLTNYGADPKKNVEIVNFLKEQAEERNRIFYDIYSEEEKLADLAKRDTGLFFFRGNPGARFAVCNAGGAFAFVGAMHDSFLIHWRYPKQASTRLL